MDDRDVVVIGAGLAGLRAATRLAESGRDVLVLEAADVVGGRQRTDVVDGFLLDRGFQVLNPAYPAVRRWVDTDALRLHEFPAGVRVRRESGSVDLTHPVRNPAGIPATLRSGLVTPSTILALTRWLAPVLAKPQSVIDGDDATLRAAWDRVGVDGPLRREVLEPFLAGVLADDDGETSDAFVQLLMRMFVLGAPAVPADGMRALPAQLAHAAQSAGADIILERRVGALSPRGDAVQIDVLGANPVRAQQVIVAVGPDAVADLVDVPRPRTRGLQTWWFAADFAPTTSGLLAVDGRRRGPIVNTVVMSNTAPTYAPLGRHLIEATCLLPRGASTAAGATAREPEVRRQLAQIWQVDTRGWQLLRRDDVPDALPAQPAPLRVTSSARIAERIYVAGDHRDTASIQGALVSGDRVARVLVAESR